MEEISNCGLKDWEQVSLPNSSSSSTQFQSQPQSHYHGRDWEMVSNPSIPTPLSYQDCSIFPPRNHEGLHIQMEENPEPKSSPIEEIPCHLFDSRLKISEKFLPSLRLGFEVLYSKLLLLCFRLRFSSWGHFARRDSWSSATAVAVAGLVGVLLYLRRGRSRANKSDMLILIGEKDEKINQLLHQLAQMSEFVVVFVPHRVPLQIFNGSAN